MTIALDTNTRQQRRAAERQARKQRCIDFSDKSIRVSPYLIVPEFAAKNYHGQLAELLADANRRQPPWPGEFSQQAAAIHEASHCVMAAREGFALKSASITQSYGHWLGEFWLDVPNGETRIPVTIKFGGPNDELFAHLRITIAGRRGELLFEKNFCLRAGLDELAYCHIMIIPALAEATATEKETGQNYHRVWDTQRAEVDETLRSHEPVVRDIAEQLIRQGSLGSEALKTALAPVVKRTAAPPTRHIAVDADPLAY